jgi:hypothetical protein
LSLIATPPHPAFVGTITPRDAAAIAGLRGGVREVGEERKYQMETHVELLLGYANNGVYPGSCSTSCDLFALGCSLGKVQLVSAPIARAICPITCFSGRCDHSNIISFTCDGSLCDQIVVKSDTSIMCDGKYCDQRGAIDWDVDST